MAAGVLACGCVVLFLGWDQGTPRVELGSAFSYSLWIGPALLTFATERERLDERAAHVLPNGRIAALLCAPLVPGGGRGALLVVLAAAAHVASVLAGRACFVPDEPLFGHDDVVQTCGLCMYALVFLLLPAGLAARWSDRASVRASARLASPLLVIAGCAVGRVPDPSWGEPARWGELTFASPLALLEEVTRDGVVTGRSRLHFAILAALAAIALLVNLPRIVRGIREVLAASLVRSREQG